MGAKYESAKPDGYMKTRNEIYQLREKQMQERTLEEQAALRNLPEMNNANYGFKPAK